MNQRDYMRGALEALSHIDSDEKTERFVFRAETLLEQALANEPAPLLRLTDEEIEALRHKTFSTNNPFCPCDAKTMRKAAHAIMDAMERVNK